MDLIILGGVVLGITEIAKRTLGLASRYIPLTALVITGLLVSTYAITSHIPVNWELVQDGLIVALSSVGLYSGVKSSLK